ncbi:porin family protein [Marinifilum sp. D714]|uniref:type IX secretion/gliding motility protein PorT/SprT n=1 Tax=Marinifilum sp. D714 TaxID=2937523 RepID=UPI0027D0EF15|nr:porin family protein [Marinifilum sp. D714]MDQ2178219.1 PorT family protein [Marinifilum sp. D714]
MKRLLLILLCLSLFSSAFSQSRYKPESILNYQKVDQKWLHFGFTLAVNNMDFALYNSGVNDARAEQVVFSPGFSVGIVSDLRLHENWSLRFLPGLEFGERTIKYSNLPQEDVTVESVLVNLPLMLKYRAKRLNNYRPYLIGGASYKIDVQSQDALDPENNMLIRLNSTDVYLELGAGIDFYLPYFKLATELKFAIGLRDIINHSYDIENPGYEAYTDAIRGMNSKIVTLSFHFE